MTDVRQENEENWRIATNKVIADKLVESIAELLKGKATHYICCDKINQHEKIVIEYNHKRKNDV